MWKLGDVAVQRWTLLTNWRYRYEGAFRYRSFDFKETTVDVGDTAMQDGIEGM